MEYKPVFCGKYCSAPCIGLVPRKGMRAVTLNAARCKKYDVELKASQDEGIRRLERDEKCLAEWGTNAAAT